MRARTMLLTATAAVLVAVPVTAGAAPAPQKVTAHLVPVAPARGGSGSLTGSAAVGRGGVQFKWHLALARLSGKPTAAMLKISGKGITFALCKPCSTNGRGTLSLITSLWTQIANGHGVLVIKTAAHPSGELRGVLKVR